MRAYSDRVYGESSIATSLCGSLKGQSLCCNGNCNEFARQFKGTEFIV